MKLSTPQFKKIHLDISKLWLLSLFSALVLIIAVTIYAINTFIDSFQADATMGTEGIPVESISRESLKESVELFDARIRRFESVSARYETTPDPSR